MIKTARRPSIQILETGEIASIISEACQDSIPPFAASDREGYERFLVEDPLILGERALFFNTSREGSLGRPATPVLIRGADSEKGPNPQRCMVLKDCIAPIIRRNPKTGGLFVLWWWNAWSPDFAGDWIDPRQNPEGANPDQTEELPQPSREFYLSHVCPSEEHLAVLGTLTPNRNPGRFDVRRPFFVNPVFDAHSVDLFPLVSAETDKNGFDLSKLRRSAGTDWLLSAIQRGLFRTQVPAIPTRLLGELTPERLFWEQTGGIKALNQHIKVAISNSRTPHYISEAKKSFISGEQELEEYPDGSESIPDGCTWEDHRIIVNSVLAHSSMVGLSNTNRVLMYSRANIYNGMILKSRKKSSYRNIPADWPAVLETVYGVSFLVLDPPRVVSSHPYAHNQQQLVNADYLLPYLYNGVTSTSFLSTDGRVVVAPTDQVRSQPEVDWTVGDPIDPISDMMGFFSDLDSLDIRSF